MTRTATGTAAALATVAACLLAPSAQAVSAQPDPTAAAPDFHAWNGHRGLGQGVLAGGAVRAADAVTLRRGQAEGSWTSQAYRTPTAFTQLVPSWQARTPKGSWLESQVSVEVNGSWSRWYQLGEWASDATGGHRRSVDGQQDAHGSVSTDTYLAPATGPASAYRLRVVLHGGGDGRAPRVRQLAATTSTPLKKDRPTSATTMRRTVELRVPQYSQVVHRDEYPEYDGGGGSWCSPTSTQMVVEYHGRGPSRAQLRTLPPDPVFDRNGRKDPSVPWAAARTYDPVFAGTGNWPFNTAYAAEYGLDASVRRLASLAEAEAWIRRGVPLVTSVRWDNTSNDPNRHLDGAAIARTSGHLMVIRGFTASGDPIVNDPAFRDNAGVRHVYRRDQFERAWFHGSDATAYVIQR